MMNHDEIIDQVWAQIHTRVWDQVRGQIQQQLFKGDRYE